MSKLKLLYFPFGGRAEAPRMALFLRGIEYEDEITTFGEWAERKQQDDSEWGSVPILTINDAKSGDRIANVGQSNAILRYAASCSINGANGGDDDAKENKDNKISLYPKDNALDCLRIDELLDAVEDLTNVLFSVNGSTPEETKQKREEAFNTKWLPFLKRFNEKLARNSKRMGNDKIEYLVGNSMTIADLKFYCHLKIWMNVLVDYVDGKKLILENKELSNITTFYQLMSKDEKIIASEKDFQARVEKYKAEKAKAEKK